MYNCLPHTPPPHQYLTGFELFQMGVATVPPLPPPRLCPCVEMCFLKGDTEAVQPS